MYFKVISMDIATFILSLLYDKSIQHTTSDNSLYSSCEQFI